MNVKKVSKFIREGDYIKAYRHLFENFNVEEIRKFFIEKKNQVYKPLEETSVYYT